MEPMPRIGHESLSIFVRLTAPNLLSVLDPVSPVAKRHGSDFQFWTKAKQFAFFIGSLKIKPLRGLNFYMSQCPELNWGPTPYHGVALPSELHWQTRECKSLLLYFSSAADERFLLHWRMRNDKEIYLLICFE